MRMRVTWRMKDKDEKRWKETYFRSKSITDWKSKVNRGCVSFSLLPSLWLVKKNSHHPLSQSDAKLTPIATKLLAFFPCLPISYRCSDWLLWMFWFPFNDTKSKWVILIHYCTIMPNDSQFYFMFRSWQSTSMQNPVNHEKSVFVWRTQFPFHIAMNQNCSSLLSPRRGWVSLDESCVLLGASSGGWKSGLSGLRDLSASTDFILLIFALAKDTFLLTSERCRVHDMSASSQISSCINNSSTSSRVIMPTTR